MIKLLEDKGILSTYHLHFKQTQGAEEHPTLYMYRHKDKPYHIDYCFVSEDSPHAQPAFQKNCLSLLIGDFADSDQRVSSESIERESWTTIPDQTVAILQTCNNYFFESESVKFTDICVGRIKKDSTKLWLFKSDNRPEVSEIRVNEILNVWAIKMIVHGNNTTIIDFNIPKTQNRSWNKTIKFNKHDD